MICLFLLYELLFGFNHKTYWELGLKITTKFEGIIASSAEFVLACTNNHFVKLIRLAKSRVQFTFVQNFVCHASTGTQNVRILCTWWVDCNWVAKDYDREILSIFCQLEGVFMRVFFLFSLLVLVYLGYIIIWD